MLTDLKKNQEAGLALQYGLQEKKAQLTIYKKFLKKAQDLTSLLKELESQGNYLLECTNNPSFSEEPWLEIKHLHRSLLQQLQVGGPRAVLSCGSKGAGFVGAPVSTALVLLVNQKPATFSLLFLGENASGRLGVKMLLGCLHSLLECLC